MNGFAFKVPDVLGAALERLINVSSEFITWIANRAALLITSPDAGLEVRLQLWRPSVIICTTLRYVVIHTETSTTHAERQLHIMKELLTTVTRKGQITLPAEIRRSLGI